MNERPASENELDSSGYDCAVCRNKGLVYFIQDDDIHARRCNCVSIRGSLIRAASSGLAGELGRCKFSTFEATEPWQKDAKIRASQYADNPKGWLYLCGQNGGGKTHLCTAVTGKLINIGMSAQYLRWKDDGAELKANVNDAKYKDLLSPFLSADVLYIDDFLKTERGEDGKAKPPTVGDINLAFQIINNRYCAKKLTIISSEHNIDELIGYDEATGSRIYEMSKDNCIMIPRGIQNNYRMKG